jgi:metal-responsive CopG/Arc/MetJ family transcriptional regulator
MKTIHHKESIHGGGGSAMASTGTKKVLVEFPEDLLKKAEKAASELSTDRSKLIRLAVETFLEERAITQLEAELAEGYRNFAAFDLAIAKEFEYIDSEDH